MRDRATDPGHLTLFNGGFCLVGHCHRRDAVRIFDVERMRSVERPRARFEVPADFDTQRYLGGLRGCCAGTP